MASGIATKRQDKELTSLLITRCYKKAGTRWRFPEVNFSDPDVNINSCLHNTPLSYKGKHIIPNRINDSRKSKVHIIIYDWH